MFIFLLIYSHGVYTKSWSSGGVYLDSGREKEGMLSLTVYNKKDLHKYKCCFYF